MWLNLLCHFMYQYHCFFLASDKVFQKTHTSLCQESVACSCFVTVLLTILLEAWYNDLPGKYMWLLSLCSVCGFVEIYILGLIVMPAFITVHNGHGFIYKLHTTNYILSAALCFLARRISAFFQPTLLKIGGFPFFVLSNLKHRM